MKKVLDVFKKPLWLLCLGLGIVLFASIFANMANTSAYSVSVKEVSFETERGTMTGLLYRPKSCTADNPCATIVTTHGYLNSKEMQDTVAVEMSKRGYVVLAMDMYEHGDSTWDATEQGAGMNFHRFSQWDAVQYIYEEDFVLKAADGTGMIAVGGHSMGGFSSRWATLWDSMAMNNGAPQKIVAALPQGADFTYLGTSATVVPTDVAAKRTMGTVAARYDEFFFTDPYNGASVREKDWTKTNAGAQFYYGDVNATVATTEEIVAGVWNETSYGGGGSIIYVPNEIHPWDHFSVETTSYVIDFYTHAFQTQFAIHGLMGTTAGKLDYNTAKTQSWWLKEAFECIALVGMFIAVVSSVALFASLPFFNKVKTDEAAINEVAKPTGARKWLMLTLAGATTFGLAYLYPMIQLGTTAQWYTDVLTWIMRVGALAVVALLVARVIISAVGKETEESKKRLNGAIVSALVIIIAALYSTYTFNSTLLTDGVFYSSDGTNYIARWAFLCSGLTILSVVIGHVLSNKKDGYTLANYGLKANWKQLLVALLIAVITVTGVYLVTFAVEALLRVDFRVWTYAIKPFGWNHFLAFFKYLPFFFLFYLANAISVIANTGNDKTWKGTLKAVLLNILGVVAVLAIHYGQDFATGVAHWPTLHLSMLLLFAVVPTLGIAAWIFRKSYFKTGNIWTGVFVVTFLFTMMQVANTILHVYSSLVH